MAHNKIQNAISLLLKNITLLSKELILSDEAIQQNESIAARGSSRFSVSITAFFCSFMIFYRISNIDSGNKWSNLTRSTILKVRAPFFRKRKTSYLRKSEISGNPLSGVQSRQCCLPCRTIIPLIRNVLYEVYLARFEAIREGYEYITDIERNFENIHFTTLLCWVILSTMY